MRIDMGGGEGREVKLDRSGSISLQTNAREVVPSRYGGGLTPPGLNYPVSTPSYKSALGKDSSDHEKNVTAFKDQPLPKASNFSSVSSSEAKSTGRWVPPSLSQDVQDRNEIIFRRVRGLLNKLTPEKFDKLYFDLINVGISSEVILKGIIFLIFEKATSEPKYSSLYAQLCLRLSHAAPNFDDTPGPGSSTFRKLLLNRCQYEFASRSKITAVDRQDEHVTDEQQEERNLYKRKMLGNIKFICELGKLGMVHEATLHKCIQQLLARKKGYTTADMAEDIECLCQIMGTIGKILDVPKAKNIMDQYFDRIQHLADHYDFPARIKFMLKDLLELREHNWVPRRSAVLDSGPRSVSQMRWEAYAPQTGMPSMRLPFPPGAMPPMFPMPPMPMPPFRNVKPDWFGDPVHGTPPLIPPPPPPAVLHQMMRGVVPTPREPEMDIFGKETTGKTPQLMAKLQKKEDLLEPHYLKASTNDRSPPSTSPQLMNTTRSMMPPFPMPAPQPPPVATTRKFDLYDDDDYKDLLKPTQPDLTPWSRGSHDNSSSSDSAPPVATMTHLSINGQQSNNTSFASKASNTPPESRPLIAFSKLRTKKNEEISLRPMFQRTQRKEDPKKEEKTVKAQQEAEKTKSKKGTLSKAEYEKRLDASVQEYLDKPSELDTDIFKEILSTAKYVKMAAVKLLKNSAYRDRADWSSLAKLVVELWKCNLITTESITDALSQAADDIKFNDQKQSPEYLALLCAELISSEAYSLKVFASLCENGKFYPAFADCCVGIAKTKGQDWLAATYKDQKVSFIKTLAGDQQTNENLMDVTEKKGLQFLFPSLYLQVELLNFLKTESNASAIYKWIKERIEPIITDEKSFIFTLVTSVLKFATSDTTLAPDVDTTQMPERDLQEKEKEGIEKMENLLRKYLDSKPHLQLEALYTMQVFCFDQGFPKGMLLRFFILFYDREIIEEEAYLKWKEDINDSYPGKGKALFQVNSWLQWLETADVEEGSEDED